MKATPLSMRRAAVIGLVACSLLFASELIGQQARPYPASKHGANYMHAYYFSPAPSSTPWAPSWSPDGKWIAVAMSGSIWKVDPATGIAHELTHSSTYHSAPDWSPDGRWIIYTADNGGEAIQLEILDVETGEATALTIDEAIYTDPVFSPDGSRVAYVSTKPNGYFNVYIRPIRNGRWAGEEIAVTADNSFGRDRLYFGEWDMHLSPAWLKDGKELLILSNRNVPLGSGNVLRVPAEAGGISKAKAVLVEQTLYRTRPHVSIDSRRFVYSSTRGAGDQFSNLYVQPTDGGEPYKLTFFSHDAFHPRWSPDGEWIAFISNEGGLPQLELLETYGGARRRVEITDRRWKRPMGVLSVRTVEAGTAAVTGSRVYVTAADGKFYAPADAYARVTSVGDKVFHHPGTFEIELPAGKTRLEVTKGFEFQPRVVDVEVKANEVAAVTVSLERLTDLSPRGWYSASTHVHMNYGGNLRNTLENLQMMAEAEDMDLVLDLIANKDNRILDHQYFVEGGRIHPVSTPDRPVVVGQEYRPPFYGHTFMLLMAKNLISPFLTGYEGTAIESLYPSNTDMFRKAKAQGAYVGYVHAFGGNSDPLEGTLGGAKGYMVDAALGTTDAVEWAAAGVAGFFPWYATLNNGLRVTAVGGEDSISSLHRSKLVGAARTYVYTGARGLDVHAWFDGMKKGHAFVSTGPIVELTINGRIPGEQIDLPPGGGTVDVSARVRSITPLERVMLVHNGDVVEEIPLNADRKSADFRRSIAVAGSGWYHLRAEGSPSARYPLDATFAQGFTNPIWVSVGDRPVRSRAAAEYSLKWTDKLEDMAKAWPGWRSQKEKDHVFGQFAEARTVYRRFLMEASQPSTARSSD